MRLTHFDFENPLELSCDKATILVIEDEHKYYEYCSELYNQINGGNGDFVLSNGDLMLPFSKSALVIHDFFKFEINDKKFINKLYQQLQCIVEEKYLKEYTDIQYSIGLLIEKLNAESDFPIDYDVESNSYNLFKSYSVKLLEEEGSLLEKLIAYMHVVISFTNIKCIFFIGLKSYLSFVELEKLYHEANMMDISLLLLENKAREKLNCESIRIIDKDLCEIIE